MLFFESLSKEPGKEIRSEQGIGVGVSRSRSPVRFGFQPEPGKKPDREPGREAWMRNDKPKSCPVPRKPRAYEPITNRAAEPEIDPIQGVEILS